MTNFRSFENAPVLLMFPELCDGAYYCCCWVPINSASFKVLEDEEPKVSGADIRSVLGHNN